jgi:hypothetical protein
MNLVDVDVLSSTLGEAASTLLPWEKLLAQNPFKLFFKY